MRDSTEIEILTQTNLQLSVRVENALLPILNG